MPIVATVDSNNMLPGNPLPAFSPRGTCEEYILTNGEVNTEIEIDTNPVFVDGFGPAFIVATAVECPFRKACPAAPNCKNPAILARPSMAIWLAKDNYELLEAMVDSLYSCTAEGTLVKLRRREKDYSLTDDDVNTVIDLNEPNAELTIPDEWVEEFKSSGE